MRYLLFVLLLGFSFAACTQTNKVQTKTTLSNKEVRAVPTSDSGIEKIEKTEAEWKEELSDEEFYVLRKKGTERAFTGDLWDNKAKGTYICRGCKLPLFKSDTKFKSGTGWPSYWAPIKSENVAEEKDVSYGMVRTEVLCGRCDGHLGHVFEDGPKPTGLRYCINSVSMDFVEEEK